MKLNKLIFLIPIFVGPHTLFSAVSSEKETLWEKITGKKLKDGWWEKYMPDVIELAGNPAEHIDIKSAGAGVDIDNKDEENIKKLKKIAVNQYTDYTKKAMQFANQHGVDFDLKNADEINHKKIIGPSDQLLSKIDALNFKTVHRVKDDKSDALIFSLPHKALNDIITIKLNKKQKPGSKISFTFHSSTRNNEKEADIEEDMEGLIMHSIWDTVPDENNNNALAFLNRTSEPYEFAILVTPLGVEKKVETKKSNINRNS